MKARTVILVVVVLVLALLGSLGVSSYFNAATLVDENDSVAQTQSVLENLQEVFGLVRDAETGQRGFLLTGDLTYLAPYNSALQNWPQNVRNLRHATGETPDQRADLAALADAVEAKLREMAVTVTLFREGRKAEALAVVKTNQGLALMERVRALVGSIKNREFRSMALRMQTNRLRAVDSSRLILVLGILVLISGAAALFFLRRAEDGKDTMANLLRGIIEGSSDQISAMDRDLRLLIFNDSFVRFQQDYNHVTPQVGDFLPTILRTLPPEPRKSILEMFQRARKGEEFTAIYQRPHEGKVLSFEMRFSPLRGRGRKLQGSALIMRDVTQVKEAEEKFEEYARRLEASNQELTDFAFIASHDLQEPLRKIQAFGDRLKIKQADRLTDEGRDFLERMQNAATRMQRLINDLLDYSRVTTKGRPPEPVDLAQVFSEVLSDLQIRIQETGARIEIGPLPPAMGDPTQLRQLFQNLVGNALKYHRAEVPPVITVTLQRFESAPPRLAIRDNGIGFEPRHAEKIFEVFQRLHGRGEFEGTGIGLAICRKIVDRHGGTITAEGHPGEGATFFITFPPRFWNTEPRRTP